MNEPIVIGSLIAGLPVSFVCGWCLGSLYVTRADAKWEREQDEFFRDEDN